MKKIFLTCEISLPFTFGKNTQIPLKFSEKDLGHEYVGENNTPNRVILNWLFGHIPQCISIWSQCLGTLQLSDCINVKVPVYWPSIKMHCGIWANHFFNKTIEWVYRDLNWNKFCVLHFKIICISDLIVNIPLVQKSSHCWATWRVLSCTLQGYLTNPLSRSHFVLVMGMVVLGSVYLSVIMVIISGASLHHQQELGSGQRILLC